MSYERYQDRQVPDLTLRQEEQVALARQAHRPVFRLIDRTNTAGGGSCVAIKLGTRLFLATAAHVVYQKHDYELILPDRTAEPVNQFVAKYTNKEDDVASLEISPPDHCVFSDAFVHEADLLTCLSQDREWPVLVVGYPGEYIRPTRETTLPSNTILRARRVDAYTLCTETIPVANWPKNLLDRPVDPSRDLFIGYYPEARMRLLHRSNAGITPPSFTKDPPSMQGMSGGAVWLERFKVGRIIQPSSQLIGLQVSWKLEARRLRGTLIGRWLELVEKNYPDLRKAISAVRRNRN